MCAKFPTCQVRVVRFYQSSRSSCPQLRGLGRTGHHRPSTASAKSQWPPPDLNQVRGTVHRASTTSAIGYRSQWALPDLSHRQTSTASARSQWAPPDLNRERLITVGTAGPPQIECTKECKNVCKNTCQIEYQFVCQVQCQNIPDRQSAGKCQVE